MGTTFEVHRSFHLPERSLFGLAGVFRSGMVQVGMEAEIEGEEGVFRRRVHSVEFVDPAPGGSEGGEPGEPALLFSYSRPEKLRAWQEVDWPGKVLTLSWRRP